jgi:hypothetical protein
MDMLAVDGFFDDFPNAEGGISGGIKIFGLDMKCSLSLSPLINLVELDNSMPTTLFLSPSPTLTICPKEGTTLMLMLLRIG